MSSTSHQEYRWLKKLIFLSRISYGLNFEFSYTGRHSG